MPFNQGVVEAVSIKPLPEPDKFGNNFKRSIKVGDDWYVAGRGKNDRFNVKTKDGWHELTKGDEIEFRYENADWGDGVKTVKSTDITIVSAAAGGAAPRQATAAPTTAAAAPRTYVGNTDSGIKIGHAINNAVNLVAAGKVKMEDMEMVAWEIIAIANKMGQEYPEKLKEMTASSSGESVTNSAATSKTDKATATGAKSGKSAKQKTASATEDDIDDDIPF